MSPRFTGLPTWMTLQLDPDGLSGAFVPRVVVGGAATALAAIGGAILVTDGNLPRGLALCAAALAMSLVWAIANRPKNLLGTHLLVRLWLLFGVAGTYDARRGSEVSLVWIVTAVFALVLTTEPVLRNLARARKVVVVRLPGIEDPVPLALSLNALPVTWDLAVAAGAVLAAVQATAWIWAALAAVTVASDVVLVLSAARRLLVDRRRLSKVGKAVKAYAPEFAIYTARPDDASYQVAMWLPYLERMGRRFVIITRNELPAQRLAELTTAPVISCRTIPETEAMLVPSLTTVFYVNASSGNGQMVRHSHLTHIYLGHGDSDKAPSYNPTHAMYDKVFAAGQAAIDRYPAHGVHIPRERFAIVGRPQVEGIRLASGPIGAVEEQTVLYAPTWRGHVDETELYSLPHGVEIVRELLARGVRVIFRPHPFTYNANDDRERIAAIIALLVQDSAKTGRAHVHGIAAEQDMSIIDCFNASDAMVSDVSSVVSDYLYSDKPFAIYCASEPVETFIEEFPVARAGYPLSPDVSNLADVITRTLVTDPDGAARSALKEAYLGAFPADSYADAFVREADLWVGGVGLRRGDSLEDVDRGDTDHDTDEGDGDSSRRSDAGHEGDEDDNRSTRVVAPMSARRRLVQSAAFAALDAASTLVAAGAALCAVSGGPSGLTLALALLTVLWICLTRPPWIIPGKATMLGWFPVHRAFLAVATASLVFSFSDVSWTPVAILVALLALGPTFEIWAREVLEIKRLRVVNLPTLNYAPEAPEANRFVYQVTLALTVGELVLAFVGWVGVMLVLAAVVLAFVFVMFLLDLGLYQASENASEALQPALEAYGAQFAVYFASGSEGAYQLAMWMPYFERLGRRFIVITRQAETVPMIQELTQAPVLLCRTLRSLDTTITPGLTTVFYVNNGIKNTHFIEHRELTHVWLNHGDSEKPACFNPVHAIYDRLFVAGQAGMDRYARHGVDISPEKFEIVGRPQVEAIDVVESAPSPGGPRTVLYAPTWVGPFADSNVYSLPVGKDIVAAVVARGCRVVFRAHPLNYGFPEAVEHMREIAELLAADKEATGRQHMWGETAEQEMSLEDCFNTSDAMIADVSAVLSDFLYSEKPFAIVAMGGSSEELVADAPVAVAAYVLTGDLANLDEVLDDLLVSDSLRAQRRETKTYYLGDASPDQYVEAFFTTARRHIDRAAPAGPAATADSAGSAQR
jgi:CDP-glycerol glycerophosphotransferase (TagB/SpsB family)